MKYVVNDFTAYGIYNGFSQYDDEYKNALREELSFLYELDIIGYSDLVERITSDLRQDDNVKKAAMAYYKPYPGQEDVPDGAGECDIPRKEAVSLIRPAAQRRLKEYAGARSAQCAETIRRAEAQKTIPTPEEARQWRIRYNNLHNEGGEGYVPYIITTNEYEEAKRLLSILEAISK